MQRANMVFLVREKPAAVVEDASVHLLGQQEPLKSKQTAGGLEVLLAKKISGFLNFGFLTGYGEVTQFPDQDPGDELLNELALTAGVYAFRANLRAAGVLSIDSFTSDSGQPYTLAVNLYTLREWSPAEPEASEWMSDPAWYSVDELPFEQMAPGTSIWLPGLLQGQHLSCAIQIDKAGLLGEHILHQTNDQILVAAS